VAVPSLHDNNLCPPYPDCISQNGIASQDTSGCAETCASGLYDCAGVCDGPGVIYGNGLCCASGTVDCAGTCDGTAVEDCAGVCGGDSVIGGCDNVCGSTAVVDECGVCGGDNSTCTDCAGVINGTAIQDDCGNCGGDCEIIIEGSCDCPEWDTMSDLSWVTDFETCSSLSCTNFSQAVWTDPFISCGSSQNNEVIADCNGVCGGDAVEDECGVCGGIGPDENFSCNGIFKPESKLDLQTAVDLWVDDNSLALSTYGEINTWDVSLITDMSNLFRDKINFNDDISNWDVSNVIYMNLLFYNAQNFNQDISVWDVSSVQYMPQTFYNASSFDQDISSWDISLVTSMNAIFDGASALSSANKCAIHSTFSSFSVWHYSSWSEYCDGR
jgi:surface protein